VAFVESIHEKIMTATLAQHNHDIEKYLIHVKNHLRMITSKSSSLKTHRGLITYILRQLKQTTNQIFLRFVQDLHVSYQEGKLPKYNPLKLILDVEDKIRVLQHAEVWHYPEQNDSSAMALNVAPALTDQLKEFLANQITTEFKRLTQGAKVPGKDTTKNGKFRGKTNNQDWLYTPPANITDQKTVQNRTYSWCTKCNKGNGQWVITHTEETHLDDYKHPGKDAATKRQGVLKSAHTVRFQDQDSTPSEQIDRQNTPQSAQLSLQDGLTNCFRFDVQVVDDY